MWAPSQTHCSDALILEDRASPGKTLHTTNKGKAGWKGIEGICHWAVVYITCPLLGNT